MSKAEMKAEIEALRREVDLLRSQLNNHFCDRAAPVYVTPVPYHPYPQLPFIVSNS